MNSMEPSFEVFDHTADAGLRVWAPDYAGLIPPATQGLYALIGELVASGDGESCTIGSHGMDCPQALRDYLAELLFLFDCQRRVVTRFDSTVFDEEELRANVMTSGVDMERSVFLREVKAITYHELDVRRVRGGVEATVIVDI